MLNKLLHILWPYSVVNKNTPVWRKLTKGAETIVAAYMMIWFLVVVLLLPLWFPIKKDFGGHIIYSQHRAALEKMQYILPKVREIVDSAVIGTDAQQTSQPIFLHGSRMFFDYTVWFGNYAAAYDHLTGRVHVDLAAAKQGGNDSEESLEQLIGHIAHEEIHALQRKRYGIILGSSLIPEWVVKLFPVHDGWPVGFVPFWVLEGYPEYVLNNPNRKIEYTKGLNRLKSGKRVPPYFKYWLLVRHAIDVMGYSVDELHKSKVDRDMVERSLLEWLEEEISMDKKHSS